MLQDAPVGEFDERSAKGGVCRKHSSSPGRQGNPSVTIDLADNIMTGVEIWCDGRSAHDPDSGREIVVQTAEEDLRGPFFSAQIAMEHLTCCGDPGIGPSGSGDPHVLLRQPAKSFFHAVLDGVSANLGLPPLEPSSVVGYDKGKTAHKL